MNAAKLVENLLGDDPLDPKEVVSGMEQRNPNYAFIDIHDLDGFTQAYLEAAFFTDEERLKEELAENNANNPDFDPEDAAADMEWSQEALEQARDDCRNFQEANAALLEQAGDDSQNGHDFWLTRNGHGAGFWDRNYPDEIGDALTEACKAFGETSAYLGDDGLIYFQ